MTKPQSTTPVLDRLQAQRPRRIKHEWVENGLTLVSVSLAFAVGVGYMHFMHQYAPVLATIVGICVYLVSYLALGLGYALIDIWLAIRYMKKIGVR